MNDSPESLLSICHQGQYVSVQELYDVCQVPGPCGQEMLCEGKIALVKGWIDYGNVFDKQHYPNLPYEKFFMRDDKQGTPLEVWTVGADNRAIFEQIYQHTHAVEKMVYIQGRLLGVDMPIMGTCHRGIKLEIDHVDSMFFK